jgi:2-dehydropantoate 2-reductase
MFALLIRVSVVKSVPDVEGEQLEPFRYVVLATKNIPDVPPSLVDIIKPAVTPGHSVIVLIQNGLNIEKPFMQAFPKNIVLSGVSRCGSHQIKPGEIVQDDYDRLLVAPFRNSSLEAAEEDREAKDFCDIYAAGGKCEAWFEADVSVGRWRKLIYNACLNPISAALDLDTGRLRLADDTVETLVRPAMEEIRAAAKACGVDLPQDIAQTMIDTDPVDVYCIPSMQMDIREVSLPADALHIPDPLCLHSDTDRGDFPSMKTWLASLFERAQRVTFRCQRSGYSTISSKHFSGGPRSERAWSRSRRRRAYHFISMSIHRSWCSCQLFYLIYPSLIFRRFYWHSIGHLITFRATRHG